MLTDNHWSDCSRITFWARLTLTFVRLAQLHDWFWRLSIHHSTWPYAVTLSWIRREHFCLESTVRGHHIYKRTWTPFIGEVLQTATERSNEHDRFAIAVAKGSNTVGHIPREISKVAWYFLQHGGEITCEISGRRKLSSIPGKGLEVPCMYTFLGSPKMIKQLVKLLTNSKA